MATYVLAGPADSPAFARASLLADALVAAKAGAGVSVARVRKLPDAWPAARDLLRRQLVDAGSAMPADVAEPVVFTSAGRFVGGSEAWAAHCLSEHSVAAPAASDAEVAAAVRRNVDEATVEAKQLAVARLLRGGKRALILVDVQNDFCAGGSLAVPHGDDIVPVLNHLRREGSWDLVVKTQDWHPSDHASFGSNNPGSALYTVVSQVLPGEAEPVQQMMWPNHCVQGTSGAEFHPALDHGEGDVVVRKGTNARVDSYSGFGDAFRHKYEKTALEGVLREHGVTDVFIGGAC